MCGIVGFVDQRSAEDKKPILKEMMDKIVHRGPDSSGMHVTDEVGLGFRRLSIIDLSEGSQPIYNEDKTKVITFNGEVYNYKALREDLVAKGHVFTTHTDTEVILHGYEEYGQDIVKKLRGMFAFVIWDEETKELFGARDHFGIKPFYYANMNGTFMYGSEIKSFLPHPSFEKELNKEALKPFMTFQYPAINETFFKGVFKLKEGHRFTYKNGVMNIEQYYDYHAHPENLSLEETVDKIDDVVKSSIKIHEEADVEIGSFLSSGVDSSYVAAVLRPNQTYSIGFDGGEYSEADAAKALADKLELNNKSRVIGSEEAFSAFPRIQYFLDEPDSNFSCVPLYFLSEFASRDMKVVMSGEGADELFAGYQTYGFYSNVKAIRVVAEGMKKLPKNMRYKIAKSIKHKHFHGQLHLYTSLAPAEEFFIGPSRIFEPEEADEILTPEYRKAPTIEDIVGPIYKKVEKEDCELRKMQYLDIHQWMPGDILLKADKMSMANSLELRVPILDRKVAEVSEVVPNKYLINAENTKYAFRQAAARHIPQEWYDRTKLGFPTPIKVWLHEDKFYHVVRDMFNQEFVSQFFDREKITQLLDDFYNDKNNDRKKIWNIYTFLVWYDIYFNHNGEMPELMEFA
ncbi:asparagine synthase (glutamine-hydrolyzing) [Catellicoccus marimammalium]|uniref:asparagine synthase (glutamine-hydrolyzing) n=1 Tax=Catellicoccus marimammalium M35/04/3 TaxID=1234409 RepID=K8ZC63_9ENTE|nr:asparagine synthase (glutamine-hydrolyzing) [Catellicoccus marimammalium]EKU27607.1 glutamine-hydrolyzing asparagine synthetase [Catellicoccus marimammalium M35/04/3]